MSERDLRESVQAIVGSLPSHVLLVAAAKTRSAVEVKTAIFSGVTAIGYNYVQEAESIRSSLREWERSEARHRV
jgi:uncharacterized pyridoxal phosphate-containing UPF0001 family protein